MQITTLRPNDILTNSEVREGIIDVYCRAFGGYPWFEQCDPREVEAKLRKEMQNTNALVVCMQDADRTVAFAWGYSMKLWHPSRPVKNMSDLTQGLLRKTEAIEDMLDAPGIASMVPSSLFYLSEFAVVPERQQQGIGPDLLTALRGERRNDEILLRTLESGPMVKLVRKAGGQTLMPTRSGNRIMMSLPSMAEPSWPPSH